METIGAFAVWIIRGIVWIVLGIVTFNAIGVDSFGSAIWWLFVWHICTVIASWILIFAVIGIASMFEQ